MNKAIEIKEKRDHNGDVFGYSVNYTESRMCLDRNIRTLRGAKSRLTYWANRLGLEKASDGLSAA